MNKQNKPVGLKQRIAAAKSVTEVQSLLLEGNRYDEASEKTRRRWVRIAKRLTEMLAAEEGKKPAPAKVVKPVKATKNTK